jgi:hypothetical protein
VDGLDSPSSPSLGVWSTVKRSKGYVLDRTPGFHSNSCVALWPACSSDVLAKLPHSAGQCAFKRNVSIRLHHTATGYLSHLPLWFARYIHRRSSDAETAPLLMSHTLCVRQGSARRSTCIPRGVSASSDRRRKPTARGRCGGCGVASSGSDLIFCVQVRREPTWSLILSRRPPFASFVLPIDVRSR